MEITKDDFDQWKADLVTKEVFKVLEERKSKIAFTLSGGGALVAPDNAVLVGRYKEIEDLLTLEFDDLKEAQEE